MRRFEAKPVIAEESDEDAPPPHPDDDSDDGGGAHHGANGEEVRYCGDMADLFDVAAKRLVQLLLLRCSLAY